MNYVLLILLIIILVAKVLISKDWLRPSTLFTVGFTYAAAILAINTHKWNYALSSKTVIIIVAAQIVIWIGEAIGIRLKNNKKTPKKQEESVKEAKQSSRKQQLLFIVSLLTVLALIVVRLININNSNNIYGSGEYLLSNYRRFGIEETSSNFVMKLLEIASSTFCYYYFCKLCIDPSKKFKCCLLMILYIISCVLSSARSGIIHFTFACSLIWILTNRYKNHRIKLSSKAKRRIALVLIAGLCSFAALGTLTGKTQSSGFIDSIEVYSAGSVPALDSYIKKYDGETHFGLYTLQGLRRIQELLGKNVDYEVSYYSHGEFIMFADGYVTNIYTCFKNYITDYGIIGSQILVLLLGILFGMFYDRTVTKRSINPYRYTLYSIIVFYVFFSFITERVFSQMVTATMIIQLILIYCVFEFVPIEKDAKIALIEEESKE